MVHHFLHTGVRFARRGLDLLLPPRCALCQADLYEVVDGLFMCDDCRRRISPGEGAFCRFCGAVLSHAALPVDRCGHCRTLPLKFDFAVALGDYDGELREAVLRMKRPSQDAVSLAIGQLLSTRWGGRLAEFRPDVVVPIPMHWTRRTVRGTNSPEILADRLGRRLTASVCGGLVVRCRNTLLQRDLSPRQRFRNMRGAFRLGNGFRLSGQRVLLVDDILTTGATCSEAAHVLRHAGAGQVAVAVVARAKGPKAT